MWKRPKQRRKQLRKLGLDERQINMVVSSRKGYWKLSRTLSTNMGMGNAWLKKQGLTGIRGWFVTNRQVHMRTESSQVGGVGRGS
jgi:hypothetical protein